MEEEGHKIIKLNIGNLAVFGFDPPDEIVQDMILNLHNAAGYTDSKAIVVINPDNPTGALYPVEVLEQIVEVARQHHLIVCADEIYDKTLYDQAEHVSIASLADDVLFLTLNGLSKNYRSCGYRAG